MNAGKSSLSAPDFIDDNLLKKLQGKRVLIKYGGNAMVDESSRENVLFQIALLKQLNIKVVVVHGGGPFIQKMLDDAGVESKFVDGHRITDRQAMEVVEIALSGKVNGDLVKGLNQLNAYAVGISGKDGMMVLAVKRHHSVTKGGDDTSIDLEFVGDVKSINTDIVSNLLDQNYLPVLSPVSVGEDGEDYNVNADMFAGHFAGELKADAFIAVTNVDGLMVDINDPESRILEISPEKARTYFDTIIKGGMIPKVEACLIGLEKGVKAAHIVNGSTKNAILKQLFTKTKSGTTIQ